MDKLTLITILLVFPVFFMGVTLASEITGVAGMTVTTLNVTNSLVVGGSAGSLPSGSVLMFNTSCPTGWTRSTAYDGKYPKGASSYNDPGVQTSTHTHAIPSHTHSTPSVSNEDSHSHYVTSDPVTVGSSGGHSHNQAVSTGDISSVGGVTTYNGACNGYQTSSDGAHTHTFALRNTDTESASHTHTYSGSIAANTGTLDSESLDPDFVTVVFCTKD